MNLTASVSIIIPVLNERQTIGELVRSLLKWAIQPEIIVIDNGSTDGSEDEAERAGAKVIRIEHKLGHDVGRAVGLAVADGDICVVVDGDMMVSPKELEPFVRAIQNGADLALNRYPLASSRYYHHSTAVAKRALNAFLGRKDLKAASMTSVPHAISRRAISQIGFQEFAVPPIAQATAIMNGLRVEAAAYVPVGTRNPVRSSNLQRLIIGDCLEAIHKVCETRGQRGGFTDLHRKRSLLSNIRASKVGAGRNTLAVIPARNENKTIGSVLASVKQAGVDKACVVDNGSSDGSGAIARRYGAYVERFTDPVGHDIARAIGCMRYRAKRYIFVDSDCLIPAHDLRPFVRSKDPAHVLVNDLDKILPLMSQNDAVSVVKRFLNIALDQPKLGTASLTGVPHALDSEVVRAIGPKSLAVPPLAYVKLSLFGFQVKAVHPINVIKLNRRRPLLHSKRSGRPLEKLILGDHLEAIAYLQRRKGPRVYFPDKTRDREWLKAWQPDSLPEG